MNQTTSWPWQDTTIAEPNYGGNSRWCEKTSLRGALMKPRESYVAFRCRMFDDYTKNPSSPVPSCNPAYSSYYCSMQDCKNAVAKMENYRRTGGFHFVVVCAVQDEPDGIWKFDDSPND
jgi:hypothetical protein